MSNNNTLRDFNAASAAPRGSALPGTVVLTLVTLGIGAFAWQGLKGNEKSSSQDVQLKERASPSPNDKLTHESWELGEATNRSAADETPEQGAHDLKQDVASVFATFMENKSSSNNTQAEPSPEFDALVPSMVAKTSMPDRHLEQTANTSRPIQYSVDDVWTNNFNPSGYYLVMESGQNPTLMVIDHDGLNDEKRTPDNTRMFIQRMNDFRNDPDLAAFYDTLQNVYWNAQGTGTVIFQLSAENPPLLENPQGTKMQVPGMTGWSFTIYPDTEVFKDDSFAIPGSEKGEAYSTYMPGADITFEP
jgi:hypothetical protein